MNDIIFNTDHLQTYPDYHIELPDIPLLKKNNNSRYKFFKQNHFTAGDEDQFLEFWDRSNSTDKDNKILINKNFDVHPNIKWSKYKNLCVKDILNTYHYISNKFKKGIFVKITDGKGKVFLPFSKVDFENEWSDKIKTNPRRFTNIYELMRYTAHIEKREFSEEKIHKNVKSWYGNNGLVRLEFPLSEGDSGVNILHDMFSTLLRERKLPSCELFINKRDFPLLKKDDTESYDSFFGYRTKLLSHNYPKYAPILSMTTTDYHADIPIPTWEDWSRVVYWSDKKMFSKEFRIFPTIEEFNSISWDTKKEIAVFRGASTGQGTYLENNIRLLLAAESHKNILDPDDGLPFLDVGITKWNLRPRKHPCSPYIETIIIEEMPFTLKPPMSFLDQAHYKYIIHLPGHSEAYRLGLELFCGSVILYYPCEYYLWFFKWLKPWVHYVPLTGSIDDVYDKVKWCKTHDDECKKIVQNAMNFANQFLTRDAILDYLQNILCKLYDHSGKIIHVSKNMTYHNLQLFDSVVLELFQPLKDFYESSKDSYDSLCKILISNDSELSIDFKQFLFCNFYTDIIKETFLIKKGKNTQIDLFSWKNQSYVVKNTCKTWKHEDKFQLLISYLYINHLSKYIPNFIFTYYHFEKNNSFHLISDHVDGITFEEQLSLPSFSFNSLIDIWIQLCLALYEAQQYCAFIHMDLYPWNIIIKTHKIPQQYIYNTDKGHVKINTSMIPVIIDYGKSHFIHYDMHYYNTSPFSFCRFQDIISIVFSSLYIYLCKHKLNEKDTHRIINIMNFFSKSDYTNKTNFVNISHIKSFLRKHKKFSKMISEPKTGLEKKSPLDFFYFLLSKHFNHNIQLNFFTDNIKVSSLFLWTPESTPLKLKFIELEFIKFFSKDWDILQFRKHWLLLEYLWDHINSHSALSSFIYIHNLHLIFKYYINIIQNSGKIVWENISFDYLTKNFPSLPPISFESPPSIIHYDLLPNYPTHLCPHCLSTISLSKVSVYNYQLYHFIQNITGRTFLCDYFPLYISISTPFTIFKFLN